MTTREPLSTFHLGIPGETPRVMIRVGQLGYDTEVFFDGVKAKGVKEVLCWMRAGAMNTMKVEVVKTKLYDVDADFLTYLKRCGVKVEIDDLSMGKSQAPEYTTLGNLSPTQICPGFFAMRLAQVDLRIRIAVSTSDGRWCGTAHALVPMRAQDKVSSLNDELHRQVLGIVQAVKEGKLVPHPGGCIPDARDRTFDALGAALTLAMDADDEETRAHARYYNALLTGLSDYEAREEGWPSGTPPSHHAPKVETA